MATANPNPPNNSKGPKVTLKIDNLNTFKSGPSPVIKMGGFKWHFEAVKDMKQDKGHSLEVKVCCQLDNDDSTLDEKLWMCKARVKLTHGHVMTTRNDGTKLGKFRFFNGLECQSWTSPLVLTGTDSCWIGMELELLEQNLNMGMMTLETDLELQFNGTEQYLAVNKFALASFSTYFRNLFFGNWSERAGDVPNNEKNKFSIIEEEDFDLPAFKLMLYSAMAMGCMVEKGKFLRAPSAMAILKLSIKYDVPMLQGYCQKYLLNSPDCPKLELLAVAEQLGIHELKDHCLATITAADVAENFGQNAELFFRLGHRTRELLGKRLNESAKKERRERKQRASPASRPYPYAANANAVPIGRRHPRDLDQMFLNDLIELDRRRGGWRMANNGGNGNRVRAGWGWVVNNPDDGGPFGNNGFDANGDDG